MGVLAAFGSEGQARPLPGGQGGTWCADGIVLKRTGLRTETAWRANTLNALPKSDEFRVAPPVRSMDGTWTAGGWEAWRLVPGTADERRVDDVVRVGRAFHAAVAELPRPAFLNERDDPWTRADRFSWGYAAGSAEAVAAEQGVPAREFDLVAPLLAARTPLPEDASQVVHGDLLGNVLFADADGLPPAVIDWPAYWRPPGWATAVVVVDALCWHGAEPDVLDRWDHVPHWRQLLVRALLFRIATHERLDHALESAYRPAIDLVLDGRWPKSPEGRGTPRSEPRPEPRSEPRREPRREPRFEPRAEQRTERRTEQRPEPRGEALSERRVEPAGLRAVPEPEAPDARPEPQQEMFDMAPPTPEPHPAPEHPAPEHPTPEPAPGSPTDSSLSDSASPHSASRDSSSPEPSSPEPSSPDSSPS